MSTKKKILIAIICSILAALLTIIAIVIIRDTARKNKIKQNLIGNTYTYARTTTGYDQAYIQMDCYRFETDGTVTEYEVYRTLYDKAKYPNKEDETSESTYHWNYSIRLKGKDVYIVISGVEFHAEMVGEKVSSITYGGVLQYKKSIGTF